MFISPEIISYADDPTLRQQMAADTVRCRLDQIPEAEGCPPCCRRLPPDMSAGGPCMEVPVPADEVQFVPADGVGASIERLPPPQPYELPPMSAEQIPSAEFQFGTAGRSAQVRALVAENRLRRLPAGGTSVGNRRSGRGGERPFRRPASAAGESRRINLPPCCR